MCIICMYSVVGWSFIDGLYFATSTLSTGGLNGIPSDSPDWYVYVYVYVCVCMWVYLCLYLYEYVCTSMFV